MQVPARLPGTPGRETEPAAGRIQSADRGRITTAGVVTEFPIPTFDSQPFGIAAGPDGGLPLRSDAARRWLRHRCHRVGKCSRLWRDRGQPHGRPQPSDRARRAVKRAGGCRRPFAALFLIVPCLFLPLALSGKNDRPAMSGRKGTQCSDSSGSTSARASA
jgi:hypothetical protein